MINKYVLIAQSWKNKLSLVLWSKIWIHWKWSQHNVTVNNVSFFPLLSSVRHWPQECRCRLTWCGTEMIHRPDGAYRYAEENVNFTTSSFSTRGWKTINCRAATSKNAFQITSLLRRSTCKSTSYGITSTRSGNTGTYLQHQPLLQNQRLIRHLAPHEDTFCCFFYHGRPTIFAVRRELSCIYLLTWN